MDARYWRVTRSARKILIAAGVYDSNLAEHIAVYREQGKTIEQIQELLYLSRASVHSYLPYSKIIYNMGESSVDADRIRLFRPRKKACERVFYSIQKKE